MASKDFTEAQASSKSVMKTIAGGHRTETDEPKKLGRPPKANKTEDYHFNLAMPIEYRDYLKKASYDASTPGNLVSMTQYLCDLIKADMEAHNDGI